MMAFVRCSSLANATRNQLVSHVSRGSLCWRSVWNWLLNLYACYVHYCFLQLMDAQLFTCNDGEIQPPRINKPYTAESPVGSSEGEGFHTNSSPQTRLLGIREEDLRRVFERLDGDGDGMVNGDDIQRFLQNLGLHCNNNIISHNDDDKDEQYFVNFDDFCGLCLPLFAAEYQSEVDLMDAFGVFDENGDGFINHRDLQRLLLSLGFNEARDLEFCKNMIKGFDINCDGRIDFMEFENMMMKRAS